MSDADLQTALSTEVHEKTKKIIFQSIDWIPLSGIHSTRHQGVVHNTSTDPVGHGCRAAAIGGTTRNE